VIRCAGWLTAAFHAQQVSSLICAISFRSFAMRSWIGRGMLLQTPLFLSNEDNSRVITNHHGRKKTAVYSLSWCPISRSKVGRLIFKCKHCSHIELAHAADAMLNHVRKSRARNKSRTQVSDHGTMITELNGVESTRREPAPVFFCELIFTLLRPTPTQPISPGHHDAGSGRKQRSFARSNWNRRLHCSFADSALVCFREGVGSRQGEVICRQ